MSAIRRCELPEAALLRAYLIGGSYADCYVTDVAAPVSHADFVEAFYTTAVFRIERWLLARLAARPSTDMDAKDLARGARGSFAAWRVEGRGRDQLLLADFTGRTRSWLMTASIDGGTRLYFGSAVVPAADGKAGKAALGFTFRCLLGFHKLYSRILLRAASLRLFRTRRG
jgi:hypothetical protein